MGPNAFKTNLDDTLCFYLMEGDEGEGELSFIGGEYGYKDIKIRSLAFTNTLVAILILIPASKILL